MRRGTRRRSRRPSPFLRRAAATCTRSSTSTWAICERGAAPAIHLQCASGRDTLSLWNEGVPQVVGVDISDVHIANARRISEALGTPATWYRCDILDTPHELDGTADLVYTGRGALGWLHDLDSWAAVIARLLRPGGILSVFDDHPVNWLFEQDTKTLVATGYDYFTHSESSQGWPATYIGDLDVPVAQQPRKYENGSGRCLRSLGHCTGRGSRCRVLRVSIAKSTGISFPKLKPELKATHPDDLLLAPRRPA